MKDGVWDMRKRAARMMKREDYRLLSDLPEGAMLSAMCQRK